ncbi:hypothetical protein A2865_04750 [Candidatus Woesebacteria bacterium RIFCSPHIGHO2_01_FULL_39_17]|uniref:Uncharacterized protein n=3 Tax=Candidatus Woeseibacteriota TaxID=1752722 RepID=A0A0G0NB30_9BACT|nr:MAG: hypothetical protein UT19_C0001G0085 [Candidatus Woesebacteria bacterium GW2011_GWB1_39_10b]KKR13369.1 MAG: hypothetical protein UT40_C0018G0014 [Candidatus Woesebacteria bacterium GW2011_GWA1_39_21b]KKS89699.1 MAG: hypothetical protein UV64_C0002G0033 [Parcubacteria group bacterium GW2011_GWC1_43_11b]OGM24327.1 MAG: hypothetical protein A2865_04750 [Candidatus Woesebacteria bacterium RIFCSPHIGHO2_01_FULL_39_17]OGM63869.1 MAG: hypothetical protein A3A52_03850 [Candidatus Woesebacteria b
MTERTQDGDNHEIVEIYKGKKGLQGEPYEMTDLRDPEIPHAMDEGQRKYKGKTRNFFEMMNFADLRAEFILGSHLEDSIQTVNSIRRLARRVGREKVRAIISEFRKNPGQKDENLLNELRADIDFSQSLTPDEKPHIISVSSIRHTLGRLLVAEKSYLAVAMHTPWNRVGAQPLDAVIEVFWFRFPFESLKHEWQSREDQKKAAYADYYKKAYHERKLEWQIRHGIVADQDSEETSEDRWPITEEEVIYFEDFEELETEAEAEVPQLTASERRALNRQITEEMGPVEEYLDINGLREDINKAVSSHSPTGLTRLIWSTLKYAQPTQWKERITHSYDLRRDEPRPLDEETPDPRWMELGDYQGRIVLPGEMLTTGPLPHTQNKNFDLHQARSNLQVYLDSNPDNIDSENIDELRQTIKNHRLDEDETPEPFSSITKRFSDIVSQIPFSELKNRIIGLPQTHRAVILHRLGYNAPENIEVAGKTISFSDRNIPAGIFVSHVILDYFERDKHKYYKILQEATELISGNI